MLRAPLLAVLGIATAISPSLRAQSDAPAPASPDQSPRVLGVERVGRALIGTGVPYRASFAADGIEYAEPGSGPESRLRLRLQSIQRGGNDVSTLDAAARAEPLPRGVDTVEFARPHGITERYELLADSIELSFEFPERPAGHGDLVARIAIESGDLEAPHGAGHRTLDFRSEAGAHVHIGAVTGVDADGRTIPGWMNWDGTHLELALPEAFVENASYPMVLDPVIGGPFFVTDQLPHDDSTPDVAYDASFDQYLFVWERRTSSSGYDVIGRRVDGSTGQPIGGDFTIFGDNSDNRRPSVASITGRNRFFVACEARSSGRSNILCCYVEADPSARPGVDGIANLTASSSPADFDNAPDVAGCATAGNDNPVIVFERAGSGIWAWEVEFFINPFPFPFPSHRVVRTLHVSGQAPNAKNPTICRSGGTSGRFFAVWEASSDFIGARALDRNLNPLSIVGLVSASAGTTVLRPQIAGDGERFLLVYQQYESGSSGRSDVWAIDLQIPPRPSDVWRFSRKAALMNAPGVDEYSPSICLPGSRFAVTWIEEQSNQRREARSVNVASGNWSICGPRVRSGLNPTVYTTMAAKREGDANVLSDEAIIGYERRSGTPMGDIAAQRYESFAGGPIFDRGGQCGGQVTLSAAPSPFAVGNPDFALDVWVNEIHTQSVLSFAIGSNPQLVRCGSGCELLTGQVSLPFVLQLATARIRIPVTCDPNAIGLQIHAQAVVITPNVSSCGIAPVSLSNRLEMVIGD